MVVAYSEELAEKVRERLGEHPSVVGRQMFGGIAFMVEGNMAVGVVGDDLMVRVGKEGHDEALGHAGTRVMSMGASEMKGWILVDSEVVSTEDGFERWVERGVTYARSLPPK